MNAFLAYDINRRWSNQFIPQIKRVVGPHLLAETPEEIDQREAADLVTFQGSDMRLAARVRRPGFAQRFPHQFTIRSRLWTGAAIELEKIVNGHGDLMFYGHAQSDGTVGRWWLLDLSAFRAALIRHRANGLPHVYGKGSNLDGSEFAWFDVRSFPEKPSLVAAA